MICVLYCSNDFITLEELNAECLLVDVYIKMCIEALSWHVGLHHPLPHKKDGDLLVQVQRRAMKIIWRRKGWSTSPVKKDWQSSGCTAWSRKGSRVTL